MKGQISFDLTVALIISLILIQSLLALSDNFLLNQERVNVRMQERQIIFEINEVLLYGKNLQDTFEPSSMGTFKIDHQIPKIYLSSEPGGVAGVPIDCQLIINSEHIRIIVNQSHFPKLGNETIKQEIENSSGLAFPGSKCGKKLEIDTS